MLNSEVLLSIWPDVAEGKCPQSPLVQPSEVSSSHANHQGEAVAKRLPPGVMTEMEATG